MGKGQVTRDLFQLHPGEDIAQLSKAYYREKRKRSLFIFLIGFLLAILLFFRGRMDDAFSEDGSIERGKRQNKETLLLTAVVGETKIDGLTLQVEKQNLTKEEVTLLYEEFVSVLLQEVLGDNASFQEVCYPLRLVDDLPGFPFAVEWSSSDYRYCREDGSVIHETGCEEQVLMAKITYRDFEEMLSLAVRICPIPQSEEERMRVGLQNLLTESELAGRDTPFFQLPALYEGKEIIWQEERDNSPILLLLLTIVTAILVYILSDQDLHKLNRERRELLKKEYPVLLMKLTLYMEAGMTLRGSFTRVADSYRRNSKKEHPLCQELTIACNEFSSGMAEGAVYERLGRRLDMQEYMRMSMLLSQNLRKGSSELRKRLGQEAQSAVAENLQYHKRKGEEAQTKLLFPMMGLLLMVMVLVMVPAFYGVTT